jgi:hypothetical protein
MYEELEIPSFLRREPGEKPAPVKERRAPRRRKAKGETIRVHLDNEIPRIGSGFRLVTVVRLGRKWVSLAVAGRAKNLRVSRRVWDSIKKVPA